MDRSRSGSVEWLGAGLIIGAVIVVIGFNSFVTAQASTMLAAYTANTQTEPTKPQPLYVYAFDQYGRGWLVDPSSRAPVVGLAFGTQIGSVHAVASRDGSHAYLASENTKSLLIFELPVMRLVSQVPLPEPPLHPSITPDGMWVYVISPHSINIVSTATGALVNSLESPAAEYHDVAFSSDGRFFYVSDEAGMSLVVGDVGSQRILDQFALGGTPAHLKLSADGNSLFISFREGSVAVFDTRTYTVVAKVLVKENDNLHGLALSRDGLYLFAADVSGNSVAVINTKDLTVKTMIAVGKSPILLLPSPAELAIYVINSNDNHLTIIGEQDHKVMGEIPLLFPQDLIFVSGGSAVNLVAPPPSQDTQRRPAACSF